MPMPGPRSHTPVARPVPASTKASSEADRDPKHAPSCRCCDPAVDIVSDRAQATDAAYNPFPPRAAITPRMICAVSANATARDGVVTDTCSGDSGGESRERCEACDRSAGIGMTSICNVCRRCDWQNPHRNELELASAVMVFRRAVAERMVLMQTLWSGYTDEPTCPV